MKIRIEKNKCFLLLGLLFIFGGSTFLVTRFSPIETYSYLVSPTISLLMGLIIFYLSFTGKKRTFFIFVGLLFTVNWLPVLLVSSAVIPYSMTQVWPIMVILSGIILIPLGYLKYKFLPITFILSSLMLVSIGSVFLPFALGITEMSITEFFSKWWPAIFILFGLVLIVLFFYMQKHEREKWVKTSDEDED